MSDHQSRLDGLDYSDLDLGYSKLDSGVGFSPMKQLPFSPSKVCFIFLKSSCVISIVTKRKNEWPISIHTDAHEWATLNLNTYSKIYLGNSLNVCICLAWITLVLHQYMYKTSHLIWLQAWLSIICWTSKHSSYLCYFGNYAI